MLLAYLINLVHLLKTRVGSGLITQTRSWCYQDPVALTDWQPSFGIRASQTLVAIRALQDSGASSWSNTSTFNLIRTRSGSATTLHTLTLPASGWTSGVWTDLFPTLTDALQDGDTLSIAPTQAGGHSNVTFELVFQQALH